MDWKSLALILGSIAGLAAGLTYLVRLASWRFSSTPENTKEKIDAEVDAEEEKTKTTGIP